MFKTLFLLIRGSAAIAAEIADRGDFKDCSRHRSAGWLEDRNSSSARDAPGGRICPAALAIAPIP